MKRLKNQVYGIIGVLITVLLVLSLLGCPPDSGVDQTNPKRTASSTEVEDGLGYASLAFASLVSSVGLEEDGHWDNGGDLPYSWLVGSEPEEIDPEWNPRLVLETESGKFSFKIVPNGAWTAGLVGEMEAEITMDGVSYRQFAEGNLVFDGVTISGFLRITGGIQQLATNQDIIVAFKDVKFVNDKAVAGEVWYTGLDTGGTVRITLDQINQEWD